MRARALFATLLLFAACGPAASPEAPTPTPVGDPHASGAEAPPGESGREPARAEAAIPPMPELPTAVGFLRFPALPERAEIAAARQRVATIVAREPAWYPTGGTEETSRWSREALAPWLREQQRSIQEEEARLFALAQAEPELQPMAAALDGALYESLVATLLAAPMPAAIDVDPELRAVYVEALWGSAEPILRRAAEIYTRCAESAAERGDDAWQGFCARHAHALSREGGAGVETLRREILARRVGPPPAGPAICFEGARAEAPRAPQLAEGPEGASPRRGALILGRLGGSGGMGIRGVGPGPTTPAPQPVRAAPAQRADPPDVVHLAVRPFVGVPGDAPLVAAERRQVERALVPALRAKLGTSVRALPAPERCGPAPWEALRERDPEAVLAWAELACDGPDDCVVAVRFADPSETPRLPAALEARVEAPTNARSWRAAVGALEESAPRAAPAGAPDGAPPVSVRRAVHGSPEEPVSRDAVDAALEEALAGCAAEPENQGVWRAVATHRGGRLRVEWQGDAPACVRRAFDQARYPRSLGGARELVSVALS
ncbi:MAG TPA: hypothetical protein RMG45_31905, partial [Polyangiaceae bacterium LLY-WYZ-15_(1-7)]|nr:hypothetical protein [Polyangiaceae bacterium LLY-WYZ-15_(1-7)]